MRLWQQEVRVQRPEHWLMKVAHNLSIDRLRRAGRFTSETNGSPAADEKDERDPAWHYQHRELRAQLDRVLDTLPEQQRSLIILYDVQGLSGATCAEILGINVGQVKVYLHRARRRMRLKLEGRYGKA